MNICFMSMLWVPACRLCLLLRIVFHCSSAFSFHTRDRHVSLSFATFCSASQLVSCTSISISPPCLLSKITFMTSRLSSRRKMCPTHFRRRARIQVMMSKVVVTVVASSCFVLPVTCESMYEFDPLMTLQASSVRYHIQECCSMQRCKDELLVGPLTILSTISVEMFPLTVLLGHIWSGCPASDPRPFGKCIRGIKIEDSCPRLVRPILLSATCPASSRACRT